MTYSFIHEIEKQLPGSLLVRRKNEHHQSTITVGDAVFGGAMPVVIAGPCSVENESQMMQAAELVRKHGGQLLRGGAYKPRTSPYDFQGLGEEGLALLQQVGKAFDLPVVSEVLTAENVGLVSQYVDVLQIGSRNMQNTDLLKAVGKQDKPVLLKRGMSATLKEFLLATEYVLSGGNEKVILCERGIRTFDTYSRNSLDINVVPAIKLLSHLPIIVDPSHATGHRELVEPLALAGLAAGAHGIMVEVHPQPDDSVSDAAQTIGEKQFGNLMQKVTHYSKWLKTYENSVHSPQDK